ncbi:MAG: hydrogenase expression protein [Chloroflexi bacterium]|nr:hydrogenase expression protein [Chloroflexota bacterium]MYF80428.1 hydrogenase expression protein [Chloroflexota bacterium]
MQIAERTAFAWTSSPPARAGGDAEGRGGLRYRGVAACPPLSLRDISPRLTARGEGNVESMSSEPLEIGKAPPEVLSALRASADRAVLQGPGVGRDAAIVRWGDEALVATTDPITFVDVDAGRLALAVNANDIFAVGAEPRWLLVTILAPPGTSADALQALLAQLQDACEDERVALVGGHTEVTDAVSRTVVSCTLIGSAPPDAIVPSDGAQDSDLILQAGPAAVEGTAILGHPQLLEHPGISIAAAARALRAIDGVHAMHDVTEGGIATAALELAEAAELSPELIFDDIIWLPETLAVCEARKLDPLGLLGSGTLLAAVSPDSADRALADLLSAGVRASMIGRVRAGIRATLSHGGQMRPLPRFARDEALRALDNKESPHPPSEGSC